MDKMKLISVRIDPKTLKKIDDLAASTNYRTRSGIIQDILRNVLECSNESTLWKIIDTFYAFDKGYVLQFKIDAEECQKRNSVRE